MAHSRPGRLPVRVLVRRRQARLLALMHCLCQAAPADPVDGDLLGVDGDLRLPQAVHGSLGPQAGRHPNADHQQDCHEKRDHADGNPDPQRQAKNRPLHLRAQIAGTHGAVRLELVQSILWVSAVYYQHGSSNAHQQHVQMKSSPSFCSEDRPSFHSSHKQRTSKAKAATSRGAGIDSRKSEGEREKERERREVGDCGWEEEGSDV